MLSEQLVLPFAKIRKVESKTKKKNKFFFFVLPRRSNFGEAKDTKKQVEIQISVPQMCGLASKNYQCSMSDCQL